MKSSGPLRKGGGGEDGRDRPAGERLKRAIRAARVQAGFTSDMQLSVRAHVHYDTFMNWFSGKTTPRPAEVKKVAEVLGVSYAELIAVYEGRAPEPVPLQDAIRELIEEMRLSRAQQDEATLALLRALAAVVRPDPAPTGTRGGTARGAPAGTERS